MSIVGVRIRVGSWDTPSAGGPQSSCAVVALGSAGLRNPTARSSERYARLPGCVFAPVTTATYFSFCYCCRPFYNCTFVLPVQRTVRLRDFVLETGNRASAVFSQPADFLGRFKRSPSGATKKLGLVSNHLG